MSIPNSVKVLVRQIPCSLQSERRILPDTVLPLDSSKLLILLRGNFFFWSHPLYGQVAPVADSRWTPCHGEEESTPPTPKEMTW